MSNSYAVVPNILPGNVTIGGNLTVGGNVIRIGAAAPFARIGKTTAGIIPVGSAFFSQNLTEDLASRDDGAQAAVLRYLRLTSMGLHGAEVNVAGVPQLSGHDESVKQLTVSVSVTGTVAETTMDSVFGAGRDGDNSEDQARRSAPFLDDPDGPVGDRRGDGGFEQRGRR